MAVAILPGSYRIGGVVYNLVGTITVPGLDLVAAPVSLPRQPLDRVFTVTISSGSMRLAPSTLRGETPAVDPVMPATPAGQDLLGWVLLYPGMTAISLADIGKLFVEPTPTRITAVASLPTMTWAELTSTITVTVLDQNGQPLPGTYTITTGFNLGNGTLTPVSGSVVGGSYCDFTYARVQASGDQSPILTFALQSGYNPLTATIFITFLDASGNVMM
jgi:hypothetical protein